MPFTTVAWSASVDQANIAPIAAVADPHVRVQGNDVIVPPDMPWLVGAYANGANITRAQWQSPSLRRFINYELAPYDRAASPASPYAYLYFADDPVQLDGDEALNFAGSEDAAGASRFNGFAWLADGPLAAVNGDIRTVRVTGATTLTAYSWTNGAITFDQTLPAGRYQIVGARFFSAGGIAFRFVFVGGIWRPGAPMVTAQNNLEARFFRNGEMGVWGEFTHNTPPTVDWFSASADTSETGYIDLIKVA